MMEALSSLYPTSRFHGLENVGVYSHQQYIRGDGDEKLDTEQGDLGSCGAGRDEVWWQV